MKVGQRGGGQECKSFTSITALYAYIIYDRNNKVDRDVKKKKR